MKARFARSPARVRMIAIALGAAARVPVRALVPRSSRRSVRGGEPPEDVARRELGSPTHSWNAAAGRSDAGSTVSDVLRLAKAMPSSGDQAGLVLELDRLARSNERHARVDHAQEAVVGAGGATTIPVVVTVEGSYRQITRFLAATRSARQGLRGGEVRATGRLFTVQAVELAESKTKRLPVPRRDHPPQRLRLRRADRSRRPLRRRATDTDSPRPGPRRPEHAMTPEARAARERKQKIFVVAGGLLLVALLAIQLPKLLGGSSSPESAATTTTSTLPGQAARPRPARRAGRHGPATAAPTSAATAEKLTSFSRLRAARTRSCSRSSTQTRRSSRAGGDCEPGDSEGRRQDHRTPSAKFTHGDAGRGGCDDRHGQRRASGRSSPA